MNQTDYWKNFPLDPPTALYIWTPENENINESLSFLLGISHGFLFLELLPNSNWVVYSSDFIFLLVETCYHLI